MDLITIGLLSLSVVIFYIFYVRRSSSQSNDNKSYPPLQSGVPLLGYVLFMRPNRYVALNKLHGKYGPIFRIQMFKRKVLVVGSIEILREAFIEQGDIFALRPKFRYAQMMTLGRGLIFQDGEDWQRHRRFVLRTLRDLGFAKSLSLDAIHDEVQTLMDCVHGSEGGEIDTKFIFSKMTNNVICSMVFGQRCNKEDKTFEKLFEQVRTLMEIDSSMLENIPFFFPFMIDFPLIMKIYRRFAKREKTMSFIHGYIYDKLHEGAASITTSSEPQSLIEAMLLQRQTLESDKKSNHGFDDDSIVADVFDLFVAGTDTTAASLTWAMALLSANPSIQTKVRGEIRKEIGLEKLPTLQDRSKLNYALAVLDEITRFASIAPTALFHSNAQDTVLSGYYIPKDTIVIPNLYTIHRDTKLWSNPSMFDPNNFLDSNGDYQPSEYLVPFSIGKRACLGESLARMELFIFFIATLQRFEVSLLHNDQSIADSLLEGDDGLVRHLKNHRIVFRLVDN